MKKPQIATPHPSPGGVAASGGIGERVHAQASGFGHWEGAARMASNALHRAIPATVKATGVRQKADGPRLTPKGIKPERQRAECQEPRAKGPCFNFGQHRASGIGHRASGVGHRASGIGHRASGIKKHARAALSSGLQHQPSPSLSLSPSPRPPAFALALAYASASRASARSLPPLRFSLRFAAPPLASRRCAPWPWALATICHR